MIEQYEFRVVEPGALGAAEAITDVARPIITFDLATYNALLRDDYRARMTGIHELGHLLLHTGQTGMAFMPRKDSSVDLERQADMFASAFLMPEFAFREMTSIRAVIKRFGVSRDAACYRARTLRMPWLISGKPAPTRNKKKGHGMNRAP